MKHIAIAVLLTLIAAAAPHAQEKATDCGAPPTLTDAQFERLVQRLVGHWRMNVEKSSFLGKPQAQRSYTYSRAEGKGLRYAPTGGNQSIQCMDGKAYGGPGAGSISRTPVNEFQVENLISSNGRVTTHNTQFISPDGTVIAYISRSVN